MRISIAFLSESGNTKLLAETAARFLAQRGNVTLTNLAEQPLPDADCFILGFGVRRGTFPIRILAELEAAEDKTLILFATAAFGHLPHYKAHLERQLRAFIPESCGYKGLFLCPGELSEEGMAYFESLVSDRSDDRENALREIRSGAAGMPDQKNLADFRVFLKDAFQQGGLQ